MANELSGKQVAILVTRGFEQVEMTEPRQALPKAGATTAIVSPEKGRVRAWNHTEWGDEFPVDVSLDEANPGDYAVLLLPGGVMNPDRLRMDERAVDFVRTFAEGGKPIAVICHGAWTLIEADSVRGKTMTSYPSLKTDLMNAGANWVDKEVVVDGNLVSSRNPDDIPHFNREMIAVFAREAERVR
jgi:protease I